MFNPCKTAKSRSLFRCVTLRCETRRRTTAMHRKRCTGVIYTHLSPLWGEQWFTNRLMSKRSQSVFTNTGLGCEMEAFPLWERLEFKSRLSHQHTLLLGCIIHRHPSIIYVTLHCILSHASFTPKPSVSALRITLIRVGITLTWLQVWMRRLRPVQSAAVWAPAATCHPSFSQSLTSMVRAAGSLTYPPGMPHRLARPASGWRSARAEFNETEATPKAGMSVLTSQHLCHSARPMRAGVAPKTGSLPVITLRLGLFPHQNLTS